MSAALLARIQPTALGALLNLFAMVYFFNRGGDLVWLAGAHAVMVLLLVRIVSNKIKAFKAEEAAAQAKRQAKQG